jgi:hypothetical protein
MQAWHVPHKAIAVGSLCMCHVTKPSHHGYGMVTVAMVISMWLMSAVLSASTVRGQATMSQLLSALGGVAAGSAAKEFLGPLVVASSLLTYEVQVWLLAGWSLYMPASVCLLDQYLSHMLQLKGHLHAGCFTTKTHRIKRPSVLYWTTYD